jgi:6-pyruvoyltetrahydropterin/6-carboxytetrahydropterin synthase
MSESFQVRVEGIQFDAAHFATYGGHCEPLHGHSYAVAAQIDGELSADSWVIDFQKVKAILREICREVDHRFMLQTQGRILKIEANDATWHILTPSGIEYAFPKADVVALPVDNTTAERLAQWFSGRLWEAIMAREGTSISAVSVEVWEGPGQSGSHRRERLPLG